MKKIIPILTLVFAFTNSIYSQTYYNMWRGQGDSGRPEWIANTAMGYPFTGIQFTTSDQFRGAVTGSGRWLFWDPMDVVTSSQNVNFINNNLNSIGHAAAGTQGSIVASRYIMTDLSSSGSIDSYYGYGRNGDVILSCQMQKWLRLNSYSGIAMWGNGGAESNDNPSLIIAGNYIEAQLPFVQKNGAITLIRNNITTQLNLNGSNSAAWFGTTSNHGIEIGTNGSSAMYIGNGQNLFLGFDKINADAISDALKTKYNVFVKKGILSVDYAIAPINTWSDFVFKQDYHLKPLEEVESFIEENGHLPDVPSAETVKQEGYSQHEINKILLQKIEELTLYTIRQQKEIENMKRDIQKTDK